MPLSSKQKPLTEPTSSKARPFLKWAGGKAQLVDHLLEYIPQHFGCYHELFLGGGALFFALQPKQAVLSDINQELISTYQAIQQHVEQVIETLLALPTSQEDYYRMRAQKTAELTLVQTAARMIYLNKLCFNGLFRVNKHGQFNVPYGRRVVKKLFNTNHLRAASQALQGVNLQCKSIFTAGHTSCAQIKRGDFVYLDPPYDPVSATASFTSYQSQPFNRQSQEQLATLFKRLAQRGVHVLLSNSDTPYIRSLYQEFTIHKLMARRSINSQANKRGPVPELLIAAIHSVKSKQKPLHQPANYA